MTRQLVFFPILVFLIGFIFLFNGVHAYIDTHNHNLINYNKSNYKLVKSINNSYIENNFRSIDSSQVNNLYSEKEIIFKDPPISELKNNDIFVVIKKKPINPAIINRKNHNITLDSLYLSYASLDFSDYSIKKQKFIKTVLPLISYENMKIALVRKKLIDLRGQLTSSNTLDNNDLNYIYKLSKKYKVNFENKHKIDILDQLLKTVDIIPNSIALAQAANESAWGTSRFAREYNALFGEYTYDFSNGVVPLKRNEGAKHLVKSFTSYDKSVQSYFDNINTHYAYNNFREIRNVMRDKNNFSNIFLLVNTLNAYAEDTNYIKTISSIIKSNKLEKFDKFDLTLFKS